MIVKSSDPLYLQTLLELQVMRAGVVPYVFDENGMLKFLLGKKTRNKKLTEFGGGCKVKKKEFLINCAMREYQEETLNQVVSPFASGNVDFSSRKQDCNRFHYRSGNATMGNHFLSLSNRLFGAYRI